MHFGVGDAVELQIGGEALEDEGAASTAVGVEAGFGADVLGEQELVRVAALISSMIVFTTSTSGTRVRVRVADFAIRSNCTVAPRCAVLHC